MKKGLLLQTENASFRVGTTTNRKLKLLCQRTGIPASSVYRAALNILVGMVESLPFEHYCRLIVEHSGDYDRRNPFTVSTYKPREDWYQVAQESFGTPGPRTPREMVQIAPVVVFADFLMKE